MLFRLASKIALAINDKFLTDFRKGIILLKCMSLFSAFKYIYYVTRRFYVMKKVFQKKLSVF